jgi:RimJ/RimL family protein N-acetyltransferase
MFKKAFTIVNSKRLMLRHVQDDDFNSLFTYRNDSVVAKYQSWTEKSEYELRKLIEKQKSLQPGIPGIWFMFAIQLNEKPIMIGDCAFGIIEEDIRQAELGVTLSPLFQGKGYAKEAITCVLTLVFNNSDIERIVMITNRENNSCIKLVKNLGFNLINPTSGFKDSLTNSELFGLKDNELMFAMSRDDWFLIS